MYYHASQTKDIKVLEPRVSNHNKPLIYFSDKRENVLVYLSNAIEKYCIERGFGYDGIYSTWASYGFNKDGVLQIEEYYPNATYETYKGVQGYIYQVENISKVEKLEEIPNVYVTSTNSEVVSCEFISDAYEEIMKSVEEGKICILRYEDLSEEKKVWIKNIVQKEYDEASLHPEYRFFLENKFPFIKKDK